MFYAYWNQFTDLLSKERWQLPLQQVKQRHCLPDSRFIDIDGLSVHYRDVGDGPVLLCLHGIFSSLHTWQEWTTQLSDDYRVISLDLPNFGITGPHPDGMRKQLYSDFLNRFTDALGIDHCYLAGNSLGGWMSYEFAYRFPHKVDKLILIDSAGFFFVPPATLIAMGLPLVGWPMSQSPLPRKLVHSMVDSTYAQPQRLDNSIRNRYYDLMRRPGNRRAGAAVVAFIRNNIGFDTSYLPQISQPTLVMWGKQDGWIPPAHATKFEQQLPDCQRIMYHNCGHLPMEELPQHTAQDCRRFLQQP